MSRHRNVRSMNYKDEYDGYDDVYGHSVEDDSCISPSDAAQWIYDRNNRSGVQHGIGSYLDADKDIPEENEEEDEVEFGRRDSVDLPQLSSVEKAKLASCLEEIKNVIGETIPERSIVEIIIKHDFDLAKSLDEALNSNNSSKEDFSKKGTSDKGKFETDVNIKFSQQILQDANRGSGDVTKVITQAKGNVVKGFLAPTITQEQVKSSLSITPRSTSPVDDKENGCDITTTNSGRNTPLSEQPPQLEDSNQIKSQLAHKEKNKFNVQEQYEKDRGSSKEQIHVVVIGHVDAGKSTLMGHLLYSLGEVSQRTMHKYEQECKKLGKQSFHYAWVMDETAEERSRGVTTDVAVARLRPDESRKKAITLLDAPGHRDFIPRMIAGAARADAAVMVLDAATGEFEAGFEQGGQTREHGLLVRSLGVSQMAVVVNKLDMVDWSEERFLEISNKMRTFLKQAGYRESDVTFIPCSGLTGENLIEPPKNEKLLSWYKGLSLIQVIDSFKTPQRSIDKTFRMSCHDVYRGTGSSALCLAGRVESGSVSVGDKIVVCPSKELATVKSIALDDCEPITNSYADNFQRLEAIANIGRQLPTFAGNFQYWQSIDCQRLQTIFNIGRQLPTFADNFQHWQTIANVCRQFPTQFPTLADNCQRLQTIANVYRQLPTFADNFQYLQTIANVGRKLATLAANLSPTLAANLSPTLAANLSPTLAAN
ncbi:LOW QUALITY PROTEIN: HBS1-like protein [Ctenocephalides felis]|uniref:LOW QUALITY PROTEIN: HBS1-like protein n=1 Tax=Ctenocephalides felis TaxID=7515 RepID=UPI000E6E55C4|nr:LOW QUALITY PROTEIN: HBS1-like protein [Ctenocephalides felis]